VGSSLAWQVRVSGRLSEEDAADLTSPKRFRADIDRGQICAGASASAPCVPLPISGVGLFDGVYLDERLRIGQNLNGGGVRGHTGARAARTPCAHARALPSSDAGALPPPTARCDFVVRQARIVQVRVD
jgi:hypothetical protein